MITDPLPLRTCSRCANWCRQYATVENKAVVVSAVCMLDVRKRTIGSDTCSEWKKQE